LEYSFAESEQDKYVLVSTIEPNQEPATKKVPLQSGRRLVTGVFESVDDAKQWLTEHQDMWVDMTLKTDNYLTATEVKELHQLHDKILILRPVVKTESYESQSGEKIEELIKDKDALFVSFFKQRNKGVEPNEEIMDLFHEILSK
jgi:exonuclease SbcD